MSAAGGSSVNDRGTRVSRYPDIRLTPSLHKPRPIYMLPESFTVGRSPNNPRRLPRLMEPSSARSAARLSACSVALRPSCHYCRQRLRQPLQALAAHLAPPLASMLMPCPGNCPQLNWSYHTRVCASRARLLVAARREGAVADVRCVAWPSKCVEIGSLLLAGPLPANSAPELPEKV